jgi:hypothetical protein
MKIRIRQLRLRGVEKDYSVAFLDNDGNIRPLATIAGEISTGKTSVLEFVAYCLGGSSHPTSIEVKRQARAALLEVELDERIAVIERPLFGDGGFSTVHDCSLTELDAGHRHERDMRPIEPTGAPGSLSTLLLSQLGLAGISLKEAPTKEITDVDPMSFRDLMWLCYLSGDRYDSRGLLLEQTYPKQLKLRQVIEVVFDVHDDQEAKIAQALQQVEEELAKARAEAEAVERFLRSEEVPEPLELAARSEELERQSRDLADQLERLGERMRAATGYADAVRADFSERHREADEAASEVRYQETLIRRLVPLEAQYAEDERKLVFFHEAQTLFDPLQITICPSCLQTLSEPLSSEGGECSLCHQQIRPGESESFDLKAELRAVRARRREIDRYLDDTRSRLDAAKIAHSHARQAEESVQRQLDDEVASTLSPFFAQREQLVRGREEVRAGLTELERQQRWHQTLDRRYAEIQRLSERATALRRERAEREGKRATKQEVVADLSERFDKILRRFDFPKLDDPAPPYLDRHFVPHVRGISYHEHTSRGALTLIALAWQLSIFERAVELGHPHPGFLLIDSPQQGLAQPDEQYETEQIRLNVWNHLMEWSQGIGRDTQLVVAENTPPAVAAETVIALYGGPYGPPPYGLIDNETG